MRRRLFTFSSVLSLLLCVGTVCLWLESTRSDDGVGARWDGRIHFAMSHSGVIYLGDESTGSPGVMWLLHHNNSGRKFDGPSLVGFKYLTEARGFAVGVPMWFIASSLALLGFISRRRAKRMSVQPGRCRQCGYDLRATPDRCPECGTAAKANA